MGPKLTPKWPKVPNSGHFPKAKAPGATRATAVGRLWKRDEMIYRACDIQKTFT
jgi:hypothetical protein